MHAKKSLGQNFLKSAEAVRDIISAGTLSPEDTVVEIGPGKGVLTKKLLEQAGKVIAIEKDTRLIPVLQEIFKEEINSRKLEIREEDILESDPKTFSSPYKIIANIPYYITGALVRKFLSTSHQPTRMVLLLQKEVAQRIVARDKKESILSISVKVYGTPKYINTVKAKYFSPEPKVDSGILLIENISKDFFKNISEDRFFEIIKTGFAHKRKMALGNLKELFSAEILENAFLQAHIQKTARAEDIMLEQWYSLIKNIG
ncbi:ribosomal RNA small subunit methyltransferase A [Patescibacteria group bacterium]|nr:ribosomal RNA small subunit methyltransferase A [Patescibacteria group bacterium]